MIGRMDLQELSRRLENLIRFGTIHSIDHPARRARVQTGRIITAPLRWLEYRAGETKTWNPPTLGEQCIVLSPSGELGQGIVIYGAPSDIIDTPSHAPEQHVIKFPDGATVTYNHQTSHLHIAGIRSATIQASEEIIIDTPETRCTGNLTVAHSLVTAAEGGTATIRGNAHFLGTSVRHNDRDIGDTHTHSGIQPGGANTQEPNP